MKYGKGLGHPNRFRFTIEANPDTLLARLIHLEQSYSPSDIGFGLHVMAEIVAQIGATISAEASAEGFVLTLIVPNKEQGNWAI
jgi:hypothetical protein